VLDIWLEELTRGSAIEWQIVVLRLGGALVLAGLIGVEREMVEKSAGLRTHMLTGVAACLYSLVMLSILEMTGDAGQHVRADPIRIVEAVTQGVAFLAAGLIIFARGEVQGLTTGAGMWLAGAIGLSCGLGLWTLASCATVLALVVMRLLKSANRVLPSRGHGSDAGPPD